MELSEIIKLGFLLVGGLFSGFYAAGVGGGGLISFPLLLLAGLPPVPAIATNKFASIFLQVSSSLKYYREGKVHIRKLLPYLILSTIGVVIGSLIVVSINQEIMRIIIIFLLIIVAIIFIWKKDWGLKERKVGKRNKTLGSIGVSVAGVYYGFFGPGLGPISIFLYLVLGLNYLQAAAATRLTYFFGAIVASTIFISQGLVEFIYAIPLAVGWIIGGWFGAGYAVKKGERWLKIILIIIISITIIKQVIDLF